MQYARPLVIAEAGSSAHAAASAVVNTLDTSSVVGLANELTRKRGRASAAIDVCSRVETATTSS